VTQPESTFDVFISYHSADRPWVEKLKSELLRRRLRVWVDFDQVLPGDRFAEVLERGILSARSVALIVSSGSLQSEWVKEEYYRALGLANASERKLRLIPVLIESVAIPGFLSSRSWADFRDSAKFEENVERLCRGIAGVHEPEAPPEQAGRPQETSQPARSVDEVTYLDRSLQRELRTVRQLQWARFTSPIPGLAAFLALWMLNPEMQSSTQALTGIAAPLTTALIGWGVTARSLSNSKLNVKRLSCLKDGIELCRANSGPGCPKLWTEFWRVLHRDAGVDTV
jgi:hypothetical protein